MVSSFILKSFMIDFLIQLKIGLLLKYYEIVLDKYICYIFFVLMNYK